MCIRDSVYLVGEAHCRIELYRLTRDEQYLPNCLAHSVESLSEVLPGRRTRLVGPQQSSQRLPAMWVVRLDDEVCQERACLIRRKADNAFVTSCDPERTEEVVS